MAKLQKEKVVNFRGEKDVAHGIESLWDDVEKALPFIENQLELVNTIYSRYSSSPKRKRKLRRTAEVFKVLYLALSRIVETRYVKFLSLAIDSILKMFQIISAVLEDDCQSSGSDADVAFGLLRVLRSETWVPHLCAIADVTDHLVSLSCSAQSSRFSIFDYVDAKKKLFDKIRVMACDDFSVEDQIGSSGKFYCFRLKKYKEDLNNKRFKGVRLGKLNRSMALRSSRAGVDCMKVALASVKQICNEILNHDDRLQTSSFMTAVDTALNPNEIDFSECSYSEDLYVSSLCTICSTLGLVYPKSKLLQDHKRFLNLLSVEANQLKFQSYWFRDYNKRLWDPLGVIESFQCEKFALYRSFHEFTYLLSEVGLHKLSQSDTERVVKTLRVVEPRFSGFDERKLQDGKRDRCMQEIFLRDNQIALDKLPLDDYEQEWRKKHLHCAKIDARSRRDSISVTNYLSEESSSLLFMERR